MGTQERPKRRDAARRAHVLRSQHRRFRSIAYMGRLKGWQCAARASNKPQLRALLASASISARKAPGRGTLRGALQLAKHSSPTIGHLALHLLELPGHGHDVLVLVDVSLGVPE